MNTIEPTKKLRGRPRRYNTDEERREAIKRSKTKYMLNKHWYCDICKNSHNYTLAGKWAHLGTKKHSINNILMETT